RQHQRCNVDECFRITDFPILDAGNPFIPCCLFWRSCPGKIPGCCTIMGSKHPHSAWPSSACPWFGTALPADFQQTNHSFPGNRVCVSCLLGSGSHAHLDRWYCVCFTSLPLHNQKRRWRGC